MHIAGLFAGVGGFELGMSRVGHHAELFCDVLPEARAVLAARFAGTNYHHDITLLRSLPARVDVICAGFPCQDLSQAGQTAGLRGKRSGLVGEVFRLLSRRRVPTVVIENVPFMLQLNRGMAMRTIIEEFERRGYRWAYRVVDTFGFGIPQRRQRVFFVASRVLEPSRVLLADEHPIARPLGQVGRNSHGFYWTEGRGGLGWAVESVPTLKNGSTIGIPSPPAILLASGDVIKPSLHDAERLQGFPQGWTIPAEGVARSSARWSLLGSAVSVPVAEWIGRKLTDPGKYDCTRDQEFPVTGKLPNAARFDGKRRFCVDISSDPVGILPPPLADFVHDSLGQTSLSLRATLGFLGRTRLAKLNFAPGFIEAIERHALRMGASPKDLARRQLDLLAA